MAQNRRSNGFAQASVRALCSRAGQERGPGDRRPQEHPRESERAREHEGGSPPVTQTDRHRDERRGHTAERAAAERQGDGACALAGGQRLDGRSQAARKGDAFAETQKRATDRKPHQAGHPPMRHAGDRPDRHTHQHADPQPDVIENGAPQRIRDRVGDEEVRVDDGKLPGVEAGVLENGRVRAPPEPDDRRTRATSRAPCRSTAPRPSNPSRFRVRSQRRQSASMLAAAFGWHASTVSARLAGAGRAGRAGPVGRVGWRRDVERRVGHEGRARPRELPCRWTCSTCSSPSDRPARPAPTCPTCPPAPPAESWCIARRRMFSSLKSCRLNSPTIVLSRMT